MDLSYNVYIMTYGSLMTGFHNHDFMVNAGGKLIGRAVSVESKYRMISMGSFPAVIPGDRQFAGELYLVPMKGVVTYLDYLEGYPDFYNRVPIQVECNGEIYNALVYVLSKGSMRSFNIHNKNKVFESKGCFSWTK